MLLTTKTAAWAAENPATGPSESLLPLQLSSDTELSREGYFVLSWSLNSNTTLDSTGLRLQQATTAEFTAPLSKPVPGIDSLTVTGLVDGDYFYQLVTDDGVVSNALRIRVEHHALGRAFLFFVLGLLVFIVLLASIFHGQRLQEAADAP